METPGRKTGMNVIKVSASDRPPPPKGLTKPQQRLWKSVTATKPPDWFTDDTLPLLLAYCDAWHVHQTVSRVLRRRNESHLIDPAERVDFMRLERVQRGSASSMAQLAQKMRLSQSARYGSRSAHTSHRDTLQRTAKPWEGYGEE